MLLQSHSDYMRLGVIDLPISTVMHFSHVFAQPIEGIFIPNDLLPVSMKRILQAEVTCLLSLDNWCRVLQIVPLEVPEA